MLPVKHPATKILMAVGYCECQRARSLGQAAPACHKKEGAAHILECASIACSMMVDLIGALGCEVGCRILKVCVEREKVVKN